MVNAPSPKTTWGGKGAFGACIPIPVEIRTGNQDKNWNSRHGGMLLMAGSPWLAQPISLHKAGPQPRCGIPLASITDQENDPQTCLQVSLRDTVSSSMFPLPKQSWIPLSWQKLTSTIKWKKRNAMCWRELASHLGGCHAGHPQCHPSLLMLWHHFLSTGSLFCNLLFSPGFSLFMFSAFFFPSVIYKLLISLTGLLDVFAFPSSWISILKRVSLVGFPCPDHL